MLSLGWDAMSVSVRSESWGGLIFLCINLLHPPLIAEAAYLWWWLREKGLVLRWW